MRRCRSSHVCNIKETDSESNRTIDTNQTAAKLCTGLIFASRTLRITCRSFWLRFCKRLRLQGAFVQEVLKHKLPCSSQDTVQPVHKNDVRGTCACDILFLLPLHYAFLCGGVGMMSGAASPVWSGLAFVNFFRGKRSALEAHSRSPRPIVFRHVSDIHSTC